MPCPKHDPPLSGFFIGETKVNTNDDPSNEDAKSENETEEVTTEEASEQQAEAETPEPEEPAADASERGDETPENIEDSQPPRKKSRYQKRISQLTAQRNASEERAKQLEEQLKTLVGDDDDAEFDEFDMSAVVERTSRRTAAQMQAQQIQDARNQAEQARVQEQQAIMSQFTEAEAEYSAQNPTYEQDIRNLGWITQREDLKELILESELGPNVVHHLAKNPNDAERVAEMPPKQAAKFIGGLEVRLSAPPAAKATTAPKPVTKVTGKSAAVTKNLDEMSFEDYERWRNGG